MSKPKAKGTRFETDVVNYLRAQLGDDRIERRALHGSKDMGDVYPVYAHGYIGIIECKAHRSVTWSLIGKWQQQTIDERENADADWAALVVKRPNHGVWESTAYVTLRDLASIALPLMVCDGWLDAADETWVCMPLSTACALIRGDR